MLRAPIRFLRVCCAHPSDSWKYAARTNQILESMLCTPIRFSKVCCAHPSDSLEYVVRTHQILESKLRAPIRFLRICFVHPSDTLVYVTRTNQISYSMFRTPIRFHRVRYSNQSDLLHCVVHINHLNILLSPTRYYQQGLFARPIHNAVFRFVAFCSSNKELPTWPTLKGQFFICNKWDHLVPVLRLTVEVIKNCRHGRRSKAKFLFVSNEIIWCLFCV